MGRQLTNGPIGFVTLKDGTKLDIYANDALRGFLSDLDTSSVTTTVRVGSIISGVSQSLQQQADRIAAEELARAGGDVAVAGAGDGTGVTDSEAWFLAMTNGVTWVAASTLMVTPTGAGDYTFTTVPYEFGSSTNPAPTVAPTTFNGNWRIVEEENGGGTPVTLASGTFTVTSTPEQATEGGTLPAFSETVFTGLPAAPLASNYAVLTDLRFEFQRASGSNEALNLSGTFAVTWS